MEIAEGCENRVTKAHSNNGAHSPRLVGVTYC